jgi:hypothetical protein
MSKYIRFIVISSLILLGFVLGMGRYCIPYNNISIQVLHFISGYEILLFFCQIFSFFLFLWHSFTIYTNYALYFKTFFHLGLLMDLFLCFCLVLVTFFLIPGALYINGLMSFVGVYAVITPDISHFSPEMTFSDFWVLCMDKKTPDSTIPPMGSHIIVGGSHEGKDYICIDVVKAINKAAGESKLTKFGLNTGKVLFSIPDVVCKEFGPHQTPPSSTSGN